MSPGRLSMAHTLAWVTIQLISLIIITIFTITPIFKDTPARLSMHPSSAIRAGLGLWRPNWYCSFFWSSLSVGGRAKRSYVILDCTACSGHGRQVQSQLSHDLLFTYAFG